MIDRESRLPLVVGAVVAVLLHGALVPVWGVGLAGSIHKKPTVPPEEDRPLPMPREFEAGRDNASVSNLAWIAYDDYVELLAEHSIIEQPAVQKQQEPAPGAPIEMDPTPPAPNADTDSAPGSPGNEPLSEQTQSVPISREIPAPLPNPVDGGEVPYAPLGPLPKDAVAVVPNAPDQATSNEASRPNQTPGSPSASAKPTSAAKSDREAPPVTIIPGIIELRPGEVLVSKGIEIKTVVPRPSNIARRSTLPRNPEATLTFNRNGEVINVVLTRSTGADNWDSPVITSLLKWTATGERIENLEGELRFHVKLLLSRSD
jgi:hypothetical protein